ncbi:putative capsid protein [Millipede associated circular virus 1]|uniref:putative capsid protein n=1 Tax=Millipede associated circular virus 1 TaxID=2293296 RepID=UPI000E32E81D|nr:putative capsid protein [Millipede associated circular virus 1]AXL65926.1 putative capsid protein [Millipede associated circular virus 1]
MRRYSKKRSYRSASRSRRFRKGVRRTRVRRRIRRRRSSKGNYFRRTFVDVGSIIGTLGDDGTFSPLTPNSDGTFTINTPGTFSIYVKTTILDSIPTASSYLLEFEAYRLRWCKLRVRNVTAQYLVATNSGDDVTPKQGSVYYVPDKYRIPSFSASSNYIKDILQYMPKFAHQGQNFYCFNRNPKYLTPTISSDSIGGNISQYNSNLSCDWIRAQTTSGTQGTFPYYNLMWMVVDSPASAQMQFRFELETNWEFKGRPHGSYA